MINRKGAWYSYKGDNIGQGRDNTIKYLEDNPEVATAVDQLVREKLLMGAIVSANSVGSSRDDEDTEESEDEGFDEDF